METDGRRDRFDQIMGQGWMVVGLDVDPVDALGTQQIEALEYLDGKTVKIGAVGSDCDVIDVDGTYAKWLTSIESTYFILRPDFYLAATAKTARDISDRFDEVFAKLPVVSN